MTLHRTRNMTSDTDFQFIMGTILGQKQDSPLFKALEKASITNFGGITSLTNLAIDRLKYWDDSSGTPVNEELGHGYQQLIRCFNAFVLTKDDEGKPIHGDWQNLTMTAEFQEFQIIGFALYTMTHAPACYQDVDDLLDLSYVPSTAEDIVLFEEKQKYMYSSVQASSRKKSSLINQGANGGISTGIDTTVIECHSHGMVDIRGIDNHEITTSIPIATAGAAARSQPGDAILPLMRQYAYHPQQGRLIHSPYQLEYLANDGNNKLIHIPGETVDYYVFPLSIRDGLP